MPESGQRCNSRAELVQVRLAEGNPVCKRGSLTDHVIRDIFTNDLGRWKAHYVSPAVSILPQRKVTLRQMSFTKTDHFARVRESNLQITLTANGERRSHRRTERSCKRSRKVQPDFENSTLRGRSEKLETTGSSSSLKSGAYLATVDSRMRLLWACSRRLEAVARRISSFLIAIK
ncbi:uncharacterized protein LOC116849570 isoform X2 [Odontomachus brunneus]|uniref:uncharacterized protein LOC116849570 isoform X2 n=1 Tax=Odontomachus brunneus TaxID=486640 RepID=UPI0013F2283A|nr:uncharacterized protein LOC116849570 isoform X2 [Odontomachus brunneus]